MNNVKKAVLAVPVLLFVFFGLIGQAEAQRRVNEREIGNLLMKINVKLDDFRYGLDSDVSSNTIVRNDETQINNFLSDLKADISSLQDKLFSRTATAEDVRLILDSAKTVNDYTSRLRLSRTTQNNWSDSRKLFDELASKYNLSWNWTTGANYPKQYPANNYPANYNAGYGLSGTYRLDSARSGNVQDIALRAVTGVDIQKREEARLELEQKLLPPDTLTIDVRGNEVTLSSSIGSPVTFPANGSERTETMADGSSVRLRATLQNQVLTVSAVGGNNDYTVVFTSIENGNGLRVLRRVSTGYVRQGVSAESFYTKTDSTFAGNSPAASTNSPAYTPRTRTGQYIVPNGTILTGVLERQSISTKTSRDNEPFSLWIQAPNEFRGAVVEGYITGLSGNGAKQLTFNFESIRLPNGQTYDFSAFLQSISNEKGERIKVDAEGTAKGKGNTDKGEMIKRGGIGAGVGAVIGAVIGGGKGAAIGAIIGGAGGAGSVYIQNDKELELKPGSMLTFQSSSPIK